MNEARVGLPEAVQVPTCISGRAEKLSAHVVIQPVDRQAANGKIRHYFRPNQTRRPRNQQMARFHGFSECSISIANYPGKAGTTRVIHNPLWYGSLSHDVQKPRANSMRFDADPEGSLDCFPQ